MNVKELYDEVKMIKEQGSNLLNKNSSVDEFKNFDNNLIDLKDKINSEFDNLELIDIVDEIEEINEIYVQVKPYKFNFQIQLFVNQLNRRQKVRGKILKVINQLSKLETFILVNFSNSDKW